MSFVGKQLVTSLPDHVLADGADFIIVSRVGIVAPDVVNAMSSGLALGRLLKSIAPIRRSPGAFLAS